MRKVLSTVTLPTVTLLALTVLLLAGCAFVPPSAVDATNKAVAGAADAMDKAAAGAADATNKAVAGAADAMDKAAAGAADAAAGANKVACESLVGINKALTQVGTLSPDTSVADVLAFKAKVDPYVGPLRLLALTMGLDPVSQFILAYDAFGLLVKSLPANANVGAASNALSASQAVLIGATVQAEEALKCDN